MRWFEHELPIDPSTMTRWRKKIGAAGAEVMLSGTIQAGLKSGVIKPASFSKVNVDTTVQEKNITYPTDAKLYYQMRENLVKYAKTQGIPLRQTYVRKGKQSLIMASRYAHARQMKRSRREIKRLKNFLGRIVRDIERKIKGDTEKEKIFSESLAMAHRILEQKRDDKNKLYSIHAPEAECISKGKAHKKYEFGVKVGVVTTSKEGFVIGMKALHGNPYDGHTLGECVEQANRLIGRELKDDIYADMGYRGHNYKGPAKVNIVGHVAKKMKSSTKRWFKRRSAIEAIISHMKNDGLLDRNYLDGQEGDKINAILCGCGKNTRKLLMEFSFLLIFPCVFSTLNQIKSGIIVVFSMINTKYDQSIAAD
jgi:IS5 family transposase